MRSLRKNQQRLYYATYNNKIPVTDENGDFTGDEETFYSKPVFFYANISPAKGSSQEEVFGKNLDYSRTVVTCNMTLPIDEFSRIWIETKPVLKPDGTADGDSADYSVVQVARGLSSVAYALKKLPKSMEV